MNILVPYAVFVNYILDCGNKLFTLAVRIERRNGSADKPLAVQRLVHKRRTVQTAAHTN